MSSAVADGAGGELVGDEWVAGAEAGEAVEAVGFAVCDAGFGDEVALWGEVAVDDGSGAVVIFDEVRDRGRSQSFGLGQHVGGAAARRPAARTAEADRTSGSARLASAKVI